MNALTTPRTRLARLSAGVLAQWSCAHHENDINDVGQLDG